MYQKNKRGGKGAVRNFSPIRGMPSGKFPGNKRGEDAGRVPVQNAKYWFTIFMAQ
jgi:hypothetical protein